MAASAGQAAAGGGVLVRDQRHQRARDPGTGSRADADPAPVGPGAARARVAGPSAGSVAGLGEDRRRRCGAGGPAGGVADGRGRTPGRRRCGWSLAATRAAFEHRAVVIGADRGELLAGLAAAGRGRAGGQRGGRDGGPAGADGVRVPRPGGQWAGMGARLLESSPVFAAARRRARGALAAAGGLVACADVLAGRATGSAAAGPGRRGAARAVRGDGGAGRVVAVARGRARARWSAIRRARSPPPAWPGCLSLEDAARVVAVRSQALRALAGRGRWPRSRLAPDAGRAPAAAVAGG